MLYIILATIFYSITLILGAIASRNANTNLVAAVSNFVSVIIPLSIIIPLINKKFLINSKFGILIAFLAGITIAVFTMALAKSFSQNKVAIVVPIVFGGAIFLSAILSYIFFKEKISFYQGIGLLILGLGLLFIIYARVTGR
ncbi:MAG: EamA family transporter [Nanoarchaeota archaeon]